MVDSGQRCDTFNIVCRTRLSGEAARTRIREVVERFAAVGRPFSWWLSPGYQPPELGELLRAAGLQPAETSWRWQSI
jgi:hypothetical protein